jgi:hypothetical protein
MTPVFLSYSHQNAAKAGLIADGLAAEGYSLWWDRRLRAADDFAMDIERQLSDAACVVVVWSASARNSLWVRAEASAALEQDKLVQLAADGAKPPLPFTMLHLLDFSNWQGERQHRAWADLNASIRDVSAGQGVRERATSAAKIAGPSLFGPLIAIGAGSLGLVALSGALAVFMARSPEQSDLLGTATIGAFVAACLALGYMLMRTVEIGLASRRPA